MLDRALKAQKKYVPQIDERLPAPNNLEKFEEMRRRRNPALKGFRPEILDNNPLDAQRAHLKETAIRSSDKKDRALRNNPKLATKAGKPHRATQRSPNRNSKNITRIVKRTGEDK
jgi:hypothetical protein